MKAFLTIDTPDAGKWEKLTHESINKAKQAAATDIEIHGIVLIASLFTSTIDMLTIGNRATRKTRLF